MSDAPRNPELEHVLQLVIEQALDQFQVSLPGRIVSYDAARQSASVQPLVKKAHVDENEERVAQVLPEIHDVIVKFYGSQAEGRITVPVGIGDYGLIVFSSLSIARWKLLGGIVDPGDDRQHDVNDCVFLPGLHDLSHVPTDAPTDCICLHGPTKVGGSTGTQPTLMATSFLTALDTLVAAIATAVGTIPAGGAAGTAITTALTAFQNVVTRAGYKTVKAEVK